MKPQCRAEWRVEEAIDALWCFSPPPDQLEMKDEARLDASCWSSVCLVKTVFTFGGEKHYMRWVSALNSQKWFSYLLLRLWIGLGCNRGLLGAISSAAAPGQSILSKASRILQVSLRIWIDPRAVLFILFSFVCHIMFWSSPRLSFFPYFNSCSIEHWWWTLRLFPSVTFF